MNRDLISCSRIQEMLVEAGKHNFMFKDTPLVSVHNDNNKFRLLDDTILKQIHQSKIANMERAKKLYESLDNKEFWLKIWESEEDFSKNIIEYLRQNCGNHFVSAKKEVGLEVPKNVPLYDANGLVPSRTS